MNDDLRQTGRWAAWVYAAGAFIGGGLSAFASSAEAARGDTGIRMAGPISIN